MRNAACCAGRIKGISKTQFLQKQFSLRQHLGLEAFGKWDFNAGCGEEKRTLIENGDAQIAQIAQMHKCTLACINLTEPLNGRPWLMKISNFIWGGGNLIITHFGGVLTFFGYDILG